MYIFTSWTKKQEVCRTTNNKGRPESRRPVGRGSMPSLQRTICHWPHTGLCACKRVSIGNDRETFVPTPRIPPTHTPSLSFLILQKASSRWFGMIIHIYLHCASYWQWAQTYFGDLMTVQLLDVFSPHTHTTSCSPLMEHFSLFWRGFIYSQTWKND